jgi:hypothetical protein
MKPRLSPKQPTYALNSCVQCGDQRPECTSRSSYHRHECTSITLMQTSLKCKPYAIHTYMRIL